MPTWDDQPNRCWIGAADDTAAPMSVHLLRDMAIGLNTTKAHIARPTLINQQIATTSTAYRCQGSTESVLLSWRAGCGPLPPDYQVLRAKIYGERETGAGAPSGTYARFRVISDMRWHDGTYSAAAEASAWVEYTTLDAVAWSAEVTLPIVAARESLLGRTLGRMTWITVEGKTDGGSTANDPYARLWGLYLYAALS